MLSRQVVNGRPKVLTFDTDNQIPIERLHCLAEFRGMLSIPVEQYTKMRQVPCVGSRETHGCYFQ